MPSCETCIGCAATCESCYKGSNHSDNDPSPKKVTEPEPEMTPAKRKERALRLGRSEYSISKTHLSFEEWFARSGWDVEI